MVYRCSVASVSLVALEDRFVCVGNIVVASARGLCYCCCCSLLWSLYVELARSRVGNPRGLDKSDVVMLMREKRFVEC